MLITMVETVMRKWKQVCGILVTTAAAGAVVWGIFSYEASNAATLKTHSEYITNITSKVDKISSDTSELKGKIDVVISLLQGRRIADNNRVAVKVTE